MLYEQFIRGLKIDIAIEIFNWDKLFQNKDIHDQLKLFSEAILNTVYNDIPNKYVTCSDKSAPWLNDHTKCLIKSENKILKMYLKDGGPTLDYKKLQTSRTDLTEAVSSSKNSYYEWLANTFKACVCYFFCFSQRKYFKSYQKCF